MRPHPANVSAKRDEAARKADSVPHVTSQDQRSAHAAFESGQTSDPRYRRSGGSQGSEVTPNDSLSFPGSRRELSDGTIVKKVDAVYLRESILDPAAKMSKGFENLGVGMPSYLGVLQDWQIDSVIMYIESLK